MARNVVVLLLGLCASATASPAAADTAADPTAVALFRKGRELVEQGDWDKGCEQFRLSHERMESASIVLNLARCDEHFGRIASAWALYQRGLTLARGEPNDKRRGALERLAQDGISKLEPRLPRLRVDVRPRPDGVAVEQANRPLPIGEAVPLDPGPHEIVVKAPGFETLRRQVDLGEGKTTEIVLELKPLESSPPAAEAVATPETPRSEPPKQGATAPDQPREPAATDSGVPTWAWITGGAGIVLTAAAVGFALDARAAAASLEEKCGGDLVCEEDPSFDPGPTNARKNRGIGLAIGLGSAGLIALTASAIGIAAAPKNARVRPQLLISDRGVWLGADFKL